MKQAGPLYRAGCSLYNIAYIYSAHEEKLAKKMTNGTYKYYAGSMVYKSDKTLNYLLMDEGMGNKSSGGYVYEYHLKDHLGNVRVTFQLNGSATAVKQATEYYPFGMNYMPLFQDGTNNKYLYNGKEKQDDNLSSTNLDWYDYGARFYDPQIGRWHSVDPLAEYTFNLTPYNYCNINPMRYVDPFGLEAEETKPNEKNTYQNLLPEVTVHGKKPSWVMRMFNRLSNLIKSGGKGDSSYKGGWHLVTKSGTIDPTQDKAKDADNGEINTDDLLPAMTIPGGIPSGPQLGTEILDKIFQASQENWKSDSPEKATSDEKILEKHGGTQKTKTNARGMFIPENIEEGSPISTGPCQTDTTPYIKGDTLLPDSTYSGYKYNHYWKIQNRSRKINKR